MSEMDVTWSPVMTTWRAIPTIASGSESMIAKGSTSDSNCAATKEIDHDHSRDQRLGHIGEGILHRVAAQHHAEPGAEPIGGFSRKFGGVRSGTPSRFADTTTSRARS